MSEDEKWMKIALEEAKTAESAGEIPVGAVVVRNGELLSHAHNRRETDRVATAHAEVLAIEDACRKLGSWRLSGCTLYVTLEPCPMCTGALIGARVDRVVFGARDPRAGACGSCLDLFVYPLDAKPDRTEGVLAEDCLAVLRRFFEKKRGNN